MEITLLQGILLTVMTIIVGLDFFLEAFFIFRPLIVSTLTGLILGDITLGLKVGALTSLLRRLDTGRWNTAAKSGIRRSDGDGTCLYNRL